MRAIQVSTDVFQAIWAARQLGEEDESAILCRLLGVEREPVQAPQAVGRAWVDRMYGVTFSHGFEMYRRYLGKEFRARVVNGRWHLNGVVVDANSIANLSDAVGTKSENGWLNWNYRTPGGYEQKISKLRGPEQVRKRKA